MPTRPLSHEQRQRQARAQTPAAQAQRQALRHDYAVRRKAAHGPDPRSTARWQRLRLMVLNGEPLCMDPFKLHGDRPIPAHEVDHIRPLWEALDLAFDEANLQPLCVSCHAIKTARERRGLADVWLICGPPGAGKSAYVQQRMLPGDMMVDWDRLMLALTESSGFTVRAPEAIQAKLSKYAWAAYDGVIGAMAQHLSQAKVGKEHGEQPLTWVLGTLADRKRRRTLADRIGARCLVLAVPAEQCMAQITTDPQRQHDVARWVTLVDDWWTRYEADVADEVVSNN